MNATFDNQHAVAPDSTAVRVALWRAVHVQIEPPPHVLEDEIGFKLAAPEDGRRHRSDMDSQFTRLFRASIVAWARFIEDLVAEEAGRGVSQHIVGQDAAAGVAGVRRRSRSLRRRRWSRVSRRIIRLENELGLPLFERRHGGAG
jgi:hypothetical protein